MGGAPTPKWHRKTLLTTAAKESIEKTAVSVPQCLALHAHPLAEEAHGAVQAPHLEGRDASTQCEGVGSKPCA